MCNINNWKGTADVASSVIILVEKWLPVSYPTLGRMKLTKKSDLADVVKLNSFADSSA